MLIPNDQVEPYKAYMPCTRPLPTGSRLKDFGFGWVLRLELQSAYLTSNADEVVLLQG